MNSLEDSLSVVARCIVGIPLYRSLTNETTGNAKAGRFSYAAMRKYVSGGVKRGGRRKKERMDRL